MPAVDLICLANSYKLNYRCIAGLRVDGGGWIRPVSAREHGELEYRHYRLPDGSEPGVLDVIRIGLSNPQPLAHQPENWRIDSSAWNLIERPVAGEYSHVIADSVCYDPVLFGNKGKSVSEAQCHGESLVLVPPRDIRWLNRNKARVEFCLESVYYNLPLTDPVYVGPLKRLEEGDHPSSAVGIPEDGRILFTISLSEPLDSVCCCGRLRRI